MNKKGAGFKKEPAPLDGDSWAAGANKGCSLGYFPKNENRKNVRSAIRELLPWLDDEVSLVIPIDGFAKTFEEHIEEFPCLGQDTRHPILAY